jgi:hypothetical protein
MTFTVGWVITFSVDFYYVYGGVSYYIYRLFLLHLQVVLHLALVFITFTVGIYIKR